MNAFSVAILVSVGLGMVVAFAFFTGFARGKVLAHREKARPKSAQALTFRWVDVKDDSLFPDQCVYVGDDEYVYGLIRKGHHEIAWNAYHNGAGFGEFMTKEAAMRQIESVVERLGRRTF